MGPKNGQETRLSYWILNWPIWNRVSYMPVVFVLARSTSISFGR